MPSPVPPLDFALGALPDRPDSRDLIKVPLEGPLPAHVDLSPFGRTLPWHQRQVGCCSGCATASLVTNVYGRLHPGQRWDPAPLWIYYKARERGGLLGADRGAHLRDVMKTLHQDGVAPWFAHPTLTDWSRPPSAEATRLAGLLKIRDYQRIPVGPTAAEAMSHCLAHEKLPLLVAVQLFTNVNSPVVRFDGVLPLPGPSDVPLSAHAMMIDGYDLLTRRFHGWNSWGHTWGRGGRFAIPFDYFARPDLVFDVWTLSFAYW